MPSLYHNSTDLGKRFRPVADRSCEFSPLGVCGGSTPHHLKSEAISINTRAAQESLDQHAVSITTRPSRRKRRTGERDGDPGCDRYGRAATPGVGRQNHATRGARIGAEGCRKWCRTARHRTRYGSRQIAQKRPTSATKTATRRSP